jgi:hypothetical protein
MALRHFMFNGSYGVVDNVLYSKQQSIVRFELVLYSDETKQQEVRRIPYQLIARRDVSQASDFVDELPSNPNPGDSVIIDFGDYATIRAEYVAFERARINPPQVQTDGNGQTINQAELDAYTQLMDNFERLKEHNKRIAIWDGEMDRWQFVEPADGTLLKVGSSKYAFKNNAWGLMTDLFDQEEFDSRFGIEQMNGENNNVVALTYDWLKTRPECANTVDA